MRTLRAGVEREAIREFIIFADAGPRLHRRHRHAADIYLERCDMMRIADRALHGGAVTLLKNKTDIIWRFVPYGGRTNTGRIFCSCD